MRMSLLLIALTTSLAALAVDDSVSVEVVDGKTFILHRIEQGETLYRLSILYSVSVQQILEANPDLDAGVYQVGLVIRVPSDRTVVTTVVPIHAVAISKPISPPPTVATTASSGIKTHRVGPGETLFSISQLHGLTVRELMALNDMTATDIREGQVLNIELPRSKQPTDDADESHITPKDTTSRVSAGTESTWPVEAGTGKKPIHDPGSYGEHYRTQLYSGSYAQLQANGAVTWVPELSPNGNGTYALHKTVPVGSIIQVTNPINGRSIYAKVVGNLPAASDDNVVLKLPSTAKQALRMFDEVMYVEISYLVPRE